MFVVGNVALLQ